MIYKIRDKHAAVIYHLDLVLLDRLTWKEFIVVALYG